MSDTPVRVLIADDQHLVRSGFRLVLERDPQIEVVAEARDGGEAVDLSRRHRPDVVLMDIRMPQIDGIEAIRQISNDPDLHGCRMIVLTTYESDAYLADAIAAGAAGFLLKDVEPEELRRAVHLVAQGEGLLSPKVTARLLDAVREQSARRPVHLPGLKYLTDREREVVALVGQAYTNAQIGETLYMSPSTAKTHVGRAMAKLQARDRVHLAILAHQSGVADEAINETQDRP